MTINDHRRCDFFLCRSVSIVSGGCAFTVGALHRRLAAFIDHIIEIPLWWFSYAIISLPTV
jgi:hypothetical protein